MKRLFLLAAVLSATAGCTVLSDLRGNDNPYEKPMFYERYLNTGSAVDADITATLAALRNNPDSPELHNALGALLVEKGFPKDAEREFERPAVTSSARGARLARRSISSLDTRWRSSSSA